jgi:hypothetical protein
VHFRWLATIMKRGAASHKLAASRDFRQTLDLPKLIFEETHWLKLYQRETSQTTVMMKKLIICSVLLVLVVASVRAAAKKPHDILGLRPGMSEAVVHSRLRKIGKQQKEEREREEEGGEQEVWILKNDHRFDYLVMRFDRQHRLSFVTAVVRKDARMRYGDVAELKEARHATDGRNHSYTWTITASGSQPGYLVVARGSNPDFLASYSLYRLGQKAD